MNNNSYNYNLDNNYLLKNRIIFINGEINDALSYCIISNLLLLESENKHKEIKIYINSPGGSVSAGLGIYDTIQYISPSVSTVCIGIAASMAAIILSSGSHGKRYSLLNSQVMIHQPLGSLSGQASDIEIHAKNIINIKKILNNILCYHTKQKYDKIKTDTDRDFFMNSNEAKNYGIIDKVITKRK